MREKCNLCKLELTQMIIFLARNGELGLIVARLVLCIILRSASPCHLALVSLVFTCSVSLNLVTMRSDPYLSQPFLCSISFSPHILVIKLYIFSFAL